MVHVCQSCVSLVKGKTLLFFMCQTYHISDTCNQTCNVLSHTDAPQTSVSISPPGDIQEGTDVTLTCNSTSDLRVRSYEWSKTDPFTALGTEHEQGSETYTIRHIKSEDSGRYMCVSKYECASRNSYTHLQVSCE